MTAFTFLKRFDSRVSDATKKCSLHHSINHTLQNAIRFKGVEKREGESFGGTGTNSASQCCLLPGHRLNKVVIDAKLRTVACVILLYMNSNSCTVSGAHY